MNLLHQWAKRLKAIAARVFEAVAIRLLRHWDADTVDQADQRAPDKTDTRNLGADPHPSARSASLSTAPSAEVAAAPTPPQPARRRASHPRANPRPAAQPAPHQDAAQPSTPAVDPKAFKALEAEVAQLRDRDRSRAKAIDDITRRLDRLTSPSPYI